MLHFPRIGKEPGYTVGLQSNGAVTSALVKTILWQLHRQAGRPAEKHQGEHVRTKSAQDKNLHKKPMKFHITNSYICDFAILNMHHHNNKTGLSDPVPDFIQGNVMSG